MSGEIINALKRSKCDKFYYYNGDVYGIIDRSIICKILIDIKLHFVDYSMYELEFIDADSLNYIPYNYNILDMSDNIILIMSYGKIQLDSFRESLFGFISTISSFNNMIYSDHNIQLDKQFAYMLMQRADEPPILVSFGGMYNIYLVPKIFGFNKNDTIDVKIFHSDNFSKVYMYKFTHIRRKDNVTKEIYICGLRL